MKGIQLLKSCILPIVITALFALPADCQAEETHKLSGIQQIPFWEVTVSDQFWAPRLETNRTVTIPHDFKKCEETGQIDNFTKAAGLMKGKFVGFQWNDSDVFKSIEGAAIH